MTDNRMENEIKLYSPGGVFSFDYDDALSKADILKRIFESEGFICSEPSVHRHTDYYYSDTKGELDARKVLVRYRDTGDKANLTIKMPSMRSGMGLSRREIEGDMINDSRFDRWKYVCDFVAANYGPAEISRIPRLVVEVVRISCRVVSKVNPYEFTYDRVVYADPVSGRRSVPCYEIEFELLDKAISEDPQMVRVLDVLQDRYLFEEERISKYARGTVFLKSLRRVS